jgi:phage-related protein
MADLTVTVTESVNINGALRGSSNNLTVTGIADTFERVVTCVNSQTTTIATFAASPYTSAGAIDVDRCKYVRITNLDDNGWIEVAIVTTASNYTVLLTPGTSHILAQGEAVALAEEDTSPSFGTLENLASIQVKPVGVSYDPQVEIFAASVA